jgi:hypothetical protein
MEKEKKGDLSDHFEEWAAKSDFALAHTILKALENQQWEEAKSLTKSLINEFTIERKLELNDHLHDLLLHVILWTQSLEEDKPGEWATAAHRSQRNIAYLRIEQPSFDEAFVQKRIDTNFEYAKESIMLMDITPFRIRKPTWEELFVTDYLEF